MHRRARKCCNFKILSWPIYCFNYHMVKQLLFTFLVPLLSCLIVNANSRLEEIDYFFFDQLLKSKEYKLDKAERIISKSVFSPDAKFFAAHENSYLQSFIDKSVTRIILNDVGINFCLLYKDNVQVIKDATAVSLPSAQYIASQCKRMIIANYDEKFFNKLISRSKPFNRKFIFVIGENENKPLKSWTSLMNTTYLIFENAEPTIEIYKRIIHELYIVHDHYSTLGKGPYDSISREQFKITNNKPFSLGVKKDLNQVLGILPTPLIRFNFTIARAHFFEDMTLEAIYELNQMKAPQKFKNIQTENCWEYVRKQGTSLLDYQYLFLPFQYLIEEEEVTRLLVPGYYLSEQAFNQTLDYIIDRKLNFQDRSTKESKNTCEFLLTPMMSNVGSFYSRGPKPRIKGGWTGSDNSKITQQLIQEKLQNTKVIEDVENITPAQTVKEIRNEIQDILNRYIEKTYDKD